MDLHNLQRAPPTATDPGGFPRFSIGIWCLARVCNGQIMAVSFTQMSDHTEPYDFIFKDFDDYHNFPMVFDSLTLLPDGLRTRWEWPGAPGTL